MLRGGVVSGSVAVFEAENTAEKGLHAGQIAGDDANVGFNHGPDGDVAGVPEPVASFAVVGEAAYLDEGCGGGAGMVSV